VEFIESQQLSFKDFSKHAIHPDRGAITGKVDVSGLNAVRMMPQLSKETRQAIPEYGPIIISNGLRYGNGAEDSLRSHPM
jgi:hypothetical protein